MYKNVNLEKLIQKAASEPDILAVLLFGSQARGEAGPNSDVDVCIVMRGPEKFKLKSKSKDGDSQLEYDSKTGFEQRLAFMSDFDFDVHIYQDIPLYVRQRVLRDGHILFCRDEEMLLEMACRTITEFADFEHIYRDYLREVERGGS